MQSILTDELNFERNINYKQAHPSETPMSLVNCESVCLFCQKYNMNSMQINLTEISEIHFTIVPIGMSTGENIR